MMSLLNNLLFLLKLSKIKCIVWDVDGTLYRSDFIFRDMCDITISFIKNKSKKKLKNIINIVDFELKEGKTLSQIVDNVYNLDADELALEVENKIDRCKYLSKNNELISFFKKILHVDHIILTNSSEKNAKQVLKKLGINISIFKYIFSLDNLKENIKPSKNAFISVKNATKYKNNEYLMIGDSLYHDIIPANEYGFTTCWITDLNNAPKEADMILSSVLELKKYFNPIKFIKISAMGIR